MYTTTTNMAACQEIFFVALLLFSLVSKVLSASGTHETFEIKPNGQLTHAKASLVSCVHLQMPCHHRMSPSWHNSTSRVCRKMEQSVFLLIQQQVVLMKYVLYC